MTKQEIRRLVLLRFFGKITRSEVLKVVPDRELTEVEIEMYPTYLKLKGVG